MILEFLAKEKGIALLEANPGLILWTFIIFGIVLFLLHRFAWRPISEALDNRAEKIHGDINRAQDLKEDAEKKLTEYLQKTESLQETGEKILAQSRKEAEEQKEKIIAAAKKEARALLEQNKSEILSAKDTALAETKEDIVNLGVALASQILEQRLKTEDHKELFLEVARTFQKAESN